MTIMEENQIREYLQLRVPYNWRKMTYEERMQYNATKPEDIKTGQRQYVCALEVWREAFGNPNGRPNQATIREINNIIRREKYWHQHASLDCGPAYGRQRGFWYDLGRYLLDVKLLLD